MRVSENKNQYVIHKIPYQLQNVPGGIKGLEMH